MSRSISQGLAKGSRTSKVIFSGILLLTLFLAITVGAGILLAQNEGQSGAQAVQASHGAQSEVVTIFGLPSPGDVPTAELLEDLASLLESETGFTVNSFVAENAGSAVCALAAGQADAGFLPADAYAIAHDRYGVQVKLVVIQYGGNTDYRGQFMVRTDSGISDLSELAGLNFASPNPGSISGYILPAIYIQNTQGKDPSDFFAETVFTGGHFTVGEAVYEGFFEETTIQGGAAFDDVRLALEDQYPDILSQVKVIAYTDSYPHSTVSMAPYLNDNVEQELTDAFLAVGASSEGQALLQELYAIEGLQITDDSAYEIVREVNAFTGYDLEPCDKVYLPVTLRSK